MEKTKKKKKPLRRAEHWGAQVMPMAGRLATLLVAIVVMGLMFSALQGVGSAWLRIALSLLIVSGMLLLCANEGLAKGAQDAAASRSYAALSAKGVQLEKKDDAACYQPVKALCAALVVFGVPLVLSVIVALSAKEYTYVLQDLPTWLTGSYASRGDVIAPLGAYTAQQSLTVIDWMRLIVRLPEMMFINFFSDPQMMSASIDRLSPLFIASYPLMYVLGYLFGPKMNRKQEKLNRRAKKVAVRRAQKSSLAEELTGAQGQVHYGHKKEEHKKKELV